MRDVWPAVAVLVADADAIVHGADRNFPRGLSLKRSSRMRGDTSSKHIWALTGAHSWRSLGNAPRTHPAGGEGTGNYDMGRRGGNVFSEVMYDFKRATAVDGCGSPV